MIYRKPSPQKILFGIIFIHIFLFSLFYLKGVIVKYGIDSEISGYIQSDQYPPLQKVNLLLGSSSIITLSTEQGLRCGSWLNRGIGGSHISDIVHYMNLTTLKISPVHIVIYAGDNDLSDGKSIESSFADYILLLNIIENRYPESSVLIVSIKNSPKREHNWTRFKLLNLKLKSLSNTKPNLAFFDLNGLLDVNNKKFNYQEDGIHLSKMGMALFTKGINLFCEQT